MDKLIYQVFETIDQTLCDMLKRNGGRISREDRIELFEMLSAHYGEVADLTDVPASEPDGDRS